VTLFYRPKTSTAEDWSTPLSRATNGVSAEMQRHNPYIYEHSVADRYLSYWQKRLNYSLGPAGGIAKGTIYAVQQASGDRITVTDKIAYVGTKDFIVPAVTRSADANQVTLREYNADTYVYSAGTLPADATNGYSPDYSFTAPLAPTALTKASDGAHVAADGKMTSYALFRATPPSANWERLMVQVRNTVTNEIYQAQLRLNAGNYEATVTGMHPNVAHEAIAWAVNASNIDGATTPPVAFTTVTFSTSPNVPTALTYVSGGTVTDVAGLTSAYAVIRATPPVNYFKILMAEVFDASTGAGQQAQLTYDGANYQATFSGLAPNRAHQAYAWAVNATGDDGSVCAPISFTSATDANVPPAVTSVTLSQTHSKQVDVTWPPVTAAVGAPPVAYYVAEIQDGAGPWTEIARGKTTQASFKPATAGHSFNARVKVGNQYGTESAYTGAAAPLTASSKYDDSYIVPAGISGGSIANSSINQGRSFTGTGSASTTLAAGTRVDFVMDFYTFFPQIDHGGTLSSTGIGCYMGSANVKLGSDDQGRFGAWNPNTVSVTINAHWRNFKP
jgi:hypothetical protein